MRTSERRLALLVVIIAPLLLFNSMTGETTIWYLSGPTLIGTANGLAVPTGWVFAATAGFNGDGNPDYAL
jgi:hypothetical protein